MPSKIAGISRVQQTAQVWDTVSSVTKLWVLDSQHTSCRIVESLLCVHKIARKNRAHYFTGFIVDLFILCLNFQTALLRKLLLAAISTSWQRLWIWIWWALSLIYSFTFSDIWASFDRAFSGWRISSAWAEPFVERLFWGIYRMLLRIAQVKCFSLDFLSKFDISLSNSNHICEFSQEIWGFFKVACLSFFNFLARTRLRWRALPPVDNISIQNARKGLDMKLLLEVWVESILDLIVGSSLHQLSNLWPATAMLTVKFYYVDVFFLSPFRFAYSWV